MFNDNELETLSPHSPSDLQPPHRRPHVPKQTPRFCIISPRVSSPKLNTVGLNSDTFGIFNNYYNGAGNDY